MDRLNLIPEQIVASLPPMHEGERVTIGKGGFDDCSTDKAGSTENEDLHAL